MIKNTSSTTSLSKLSPDEILSHIISHRSLLDFLNHFKRSEWTRVIVACFELGVNEVLREIEPGVLSVAAVAALLHDRPSRSRPIGPSADEDDEEEPLEEPSASDKARMDGIKGQHAHFGPVHVPLFHAGGAPRAAAPEVTVETSPLHHSPVPSASTRAPAPALHTARSSSSSSSSLRKAEPSVVRRASWAAKPPSYWRTGETPSPQRSVTPKQGPAGGGGRSPSFWDDSGHVADVMVRPSTASSAVSSTATTTTTTTTPSWWFNSAEPAPSRPHSAKSKKKVVVNENSLAAGKATVRREPFQIGQADPHHQHQQGKRTVHIETTPTPKGEPGNPFVKQLLQ